MIASRLISIRMRVCNQFCLHRMCRSLRSFQTSWIGEHPIWCVPLASTKTRRLYALVYRLLHVCHSPYMKSQTLRVRPFRSGSRHTWTMKRYPLVVSSRQAASRHHQKLRLGVTLMSEASATGGVVTIPSSALLNKHTCVCVDTLAQTKHFNSL